MGAVHAHGSDQTALPVMPEMNQYNRRQENMSLVDSLKLYTPLTHYLVVDDALGCSLLVLVSVATVVNRDSLSFAV